MGQPLLNENEQKNLSNFLTHFDDSNVSSPQDVHFTPHSHLSLPAGASYTVPRYMGAETYVGSRRSIDPIQLQQMGDASHLDLSNPNMQHYASRPVYDTYTSQDFYSGSEYHNMFANPLQPVTNNPHAPFHESWQHSQFQNYLPLHGPGRPQARFGTDDRFGPNGFVAPDLHIDHDMNQLQVFNWSEAQSSATNTAPNSAHTTHPSSPIVSRKRTFDEYGRQDVTNGNQRFSNGVHHSHTRSAPPLGPATEHQRRPAVEYKHDTPLPVDATVVKSKGADKASPSDAEIDAEAESDDESNEKDTKPDSPASPRAPWPKNKAFPPRKPPPPPVKKRKPSAKFKAHAVENGKGSMLIRPKARPARSSTSTTSHTPRQTLTADQKRANHTNSEQRRRDLTARAYAELFDLVPDLEQVGKQSTMKRLEGVVSRVRELKEIVVALRLQRDSMLGVTTQDTAGANHAAKGAKHVGRQNTRHGHRDQNDDDWDWDATVQGTPNTKAGDLAESYPELA